MGDMYSPMPELNLLKEFDGQLSRIRTLIGRCFHKSYAVQGVAALRKRHGWTCQIPARRAIERDENAVAGWVKETWPQVEGPWRRSTPGSSSRTKPASR